MHERLTAFFSWMTAAITHKNNTASLLDAYIEVEIEKAMPCFQNVQSVATCHISLCVIFQALWLLQSWKCPQKATSAFSLAILTMLHVPLCSHWEVHNKKKQLIQVWHIHTYHQEKVCCVSQQRLQCLKVIQGWTVTRGEVDMAQQQDQYLHLCVRRNRRNTCRALQNYLRQATHVKNYQEQTPRAWHKAHHPLVGHNSAPCSLMGICLRIQEVECLLLVPQQASKHLAFSATCAQCEPAPTCEENKLRWCTLKCTF